MPGLDPCQALAELLATMHTLRAPGGCPWDAEQTPESLAPYILEEACETIEAIETGSPGMVADELGDLLLQVVFQAQIFAERGCFDFADVAAGINTKLLRRHPHVFAHEGQSIMDTNLELQWERIKLEEQAAGEPTGQHPLGSLPGNLPALQRAQKLVARAMRRDVDIPLPSPLQPTSGRWSEEELGLVLMALAKQAELNGLDAEQALRKTVRRMLVQPASN